MRWLTAAAWLEGVGEDNLRNPRTTRKVRAVPRPNNIQGDGGYLEQYQTAPHYVDFQSETGADSASYA